MNEKDNQQYLANEQQMYKSKSKCNWIRGQVREEQIDKLVSLMKALTLDDQLSEKKPKG